ncbi:Bactericidal permeability-increasing protein [Dissostichus eleginoides]|uniref:Bactericidal permeability-increasing protein n=1 Tax=Dissostichus eleginoides TaxID=100907 RepID=A0AAD9FI11_DISEL|nr:Bactericidal permeability-increasing protein [Dissostichus eleginoides]
MFLCWCLSLVALIPLTTSTNPGVKVKLTAKGIEYGRQLAVASILQKLKTIKLDDVSGKKRVSIGKVKYSLKKRDSGSFKLNADDISFSTSLSIMTDPTGRPAVNSINCGANVGKMSVRFRGGASWLYNLFRNPLVMRYERQCRKICPLVANAVSDLNNNLKTLNVLAKVDKFAEIEYSMVASPAVSKTSIDFGLKGEFYNIGKHQEPPFSPAAFSLPPQVNNMLYIGVSSFPIESAAFVYNTAGALSLDITDDMIPKISPVRLNTERLEFSSPDCQAFPRSDDETSDEDGESSTYAIQPNATLAPLFVLNLDSSVSARVFVSGTRLAGAVTLNKMDLTLGTSYVGDFQVSTLNTILQTVLNFVVIPRVNAQLAKGYPLPTLGKMKLVNSQLLVLKDHVMIGTDVQFTG